MSCYYDPASIQVVFTPGVVTITNGNRNLGELKMHTGPPSVIGLHSPNINMVNWSLVEHELESQST